METRCAVRHAFLYVRVLEALFNVPTRLDESVLQFCSFHFSTQDFICAANFNVMGDFLHKELVFQLLRRASDESIASREEFARRQRAGTEESFRRPCGENCRFCWGLSSKAFAASTTASLQNRGELRYPYKAVSTL